MKKMKVLSLVLATIMTMSLLAGCGGSSAKPQASTGSSSESTATATKTKITINVGSEQSPEAVYSTRMLQDYFVPELKARVEAETDYTIEVIESYSGTVAGQGEMFTAIQNGMVDIGSTVCCWDYANMMAYNFSAYIPFSTSDSLTAARAVLNTVNSVPYLKEHLEESGVTFLGLATTDCYQLVTDFKVASVADMAGVNIAGVSTNQTILSTAGATPISSGAGDAYTCIQTGVYHGWIFPLTSVEGTKLYEVAPYIFNMDIGCVANYWMLANSDFLADLPAEVRTIVEETMADYTEVTAAGNKEEAEAVIATLKDHGCTFTDMPAAERDALIAKLTVLPQQFIDAGADYGYNGEEILRVFVESLEAEGVEFPIDWF